MDIKKINGIETRFLDALQRTYAVYARRGSRSTDKLQVLHGWIRAELESILGNEYTIISLSNIAVSQKPDEVDGMYYPKNINISVSRDNKVIGIINVSFVNSSFTKNANNYFENQMGRNANLQNDNIILGHLFCLTEPIPHYKPNKTWTETDKIKNNDIEKYYKLANDPRPAIHKPDVQGICIAKLNLPNTATVPQPTASNVTISGLVTAPDLARLEESYRTFILTQMDVKTFFTDFVIKTEAKYNELKRKSQQSRLRKFFNCFLQKIIDVCHFLKK